MGQVRAFARGSFVMALVWGPLGTLAWLMLHSLMQRGSLSAAEDVWALRMGVFAFVVFVPSALSALVAGGALVDGYRPRGLSTFLLAMLAPLPVCAAAVLVGHGSGHGNPQMWTALLAATAVGGAGGSVVAVLRGAADEDSFYDRARHTNAASASRGWRSA